MHAAAELVCRGRVVLVSYVMSTADAVGRVILDKCLYTGIAYKSYLVPDNYVIDQI